MELNGIACPAGGDCIAVGRADQGKGKFLPVVAPQASDGWVAATVPLPQGGIISSYDSLAAAACVSAFSCYAVGVYKDAGQDLLPLLETDSVNGAWQPGAGMQLPAPRRQSPTDAGLNALSCAGNACQAVGAYLGANGFRQAMAVFVAGHPQDPVEVEPPPNAGKDPRAVLTGLSCTSPGNCLAVGDYTATDGFVDGMAATESGYVFSRAVEVAPPAGVETDGTALTGVSCALATCVVSGGYVVQVTRRTEPMVATDADGTWSALELHLPANRSLAQGSLRAVWCEAAGNCIAVGTYRTASGNDAMAVQDVAGAWQASTELVAPQDQSVMMAVACQSATECGAAGYTGPAPSRTGMAVVSVGTPYVPAPAPTDMVVTVRPPGAGPGAYAFGAGDTLSLAATITGTGTSASPTGSVQFLINGSGWQPSYQACSSPVGPSGVAGCHVVAPQGGPDGASVEAVYSGDAHFHSAVVYQPFDDMGFQKIDADDEILLGVSCPTANFCVAVDDGGHAVVYNGTSWSAPVVIDQQQLNAVSCSSPQFCVAVDQKGGTVTWDGSSWLYKPGVDPGNALVAVSCTSSSFCAAVGGDYNGNGNAVMWNGSQWSSPDQLVWPPGGEEGVLWWPLSSVSCSQQFCAAVDQYGNLYYYRGSSWTGPQSIDSFGLFSVSCPGVDLCFAMDSLGYVLNETQVVGSSGPLWNVAWTVPSKLGDDPSISCQYEDYCVALDGADNDVYTWDGDNWPSGAPGGLFQLGLPAANRGVSAPGPALSCPTVTFCVAVDGWDGEIFVGSH